MERVPRPPAVVDPDTAHKHELVKPGVGARLLELRQLPLTTSRGAYEEFFYRIRSILEEPEPTLSKDDPNAEAVRAEWWRHRLAARFVLVETLTKEDVQKMQATDTHAQQQTEEAMAEIIREGVRHPLLSARGCAAIEDSACRAKLVDGIGGQLSAGKELHSRAELASAPPSERAIFYDRYYQDLEQVNADALYHDRVVGVPLDVNLKRRLYTKSAVYATLALQQTFGFQDAIDAQKDIVRDLIEANCPDGVFQGTAFAIVGKPRGYVHHEVLETLGNAGQDSTVIRAMTTGCLDRSPQEMVLTSLDTPQGVELLLGKRPGFAKIRGKDLFNEEVARKVIRLGRVSKVMSRLECFTAIAQAELLSSLLDVPDGTDQLVKILPGLRDAATLPAQAGLRLIREGRMPDVAEHFRCFKDISSKDIVEAAMETPEGRKGLAGSLYFFSGDNEGALTTDHAERLIQDGYLSRVLEWPQVFSGLDHNALAHRALEADRNPTDDSRRMNGFLRSRDPDAETYAMVLARSIDQYHGLDKSVADTLLKKTNVSIRSAVVSRVDAFEGVDGNEIMQHALNGEPELQEAAQRNIARYRGLNRETFRQLMASSRGEYVELSAVSFDPDVQSDLAQAAFNRSPTTLACDLDRYHPGAIPGHLAEGLVQAGYLKQVGEHRRVFKDLSPELEHQLAVLEMVMNKVKNSPSRTVRRMQDTLVDQLASSKHPERDYDRIEKLFMRNHIPLVGKAFLASEIIYGQDHYLSSKSPLLRGATPREARLLLYRDLLKVHIETGNPSLRTYFLEINQVMPIVRLLEAGKRLTPEQETQAERFFKQVEVLYGVSLLGARAASIQDISLQERLAGWKQSLAVREGQTIDGRIAEMYLRPVGISSVDEALRRMDESKAHADQENRRFAAQNTDGLRLQQDDLLKGVQSEHFLSYVKNGNVCKEMLGYAAGSDATPLDTDVSRVDAARPTTMIRNVYASLDAGSDTYGDLLLMFRPTEDRYVKTSNAQSREVLDRYRRDQAYGRSDKYELFTSAELGPTHENIRTGVPFTEVRAIIMKRPERRKLLDLKMDIVANGYFVLITDSDGKPLFTPDEFDQMRQRSLAGTEMVSDLVYTLDRATLGEKQEEILRAIQAQIAAERERIDQTRSAIEERVKEALRRVGISLRVNGESAVGAEVLNTGSTSRRTSIPGEAVDFDLVLRLDESDLAQQKELKEALDAVLPGKNQPGAPNQWRRVGVDVNGTPVDIDVSFTSKPEVEGIPSHVAAEQRLQSIERQSVSDADWVRANIVYAKQVLKQAGVYKKLDGGLGGLGVENWILQHGGSFAKAREAVLSAAVDERGSLRSFNECAERYAIPDPGVNLMEKQALNDGTEKTNFRHDNFFYFLNREDAKGYEKFVRALQVM